MATRTSNKSKDMENVKINIWGISFQADRIPEKVLWGFLAFVLILFLILMLSKLALLPVILNNIKDVPAFLKKWLSGLTSS